MIQIGKKCNKRMLYKDIMSLAEAEIHSNGCLMQVSLLMLDDSINILLWGQTLLSMDANVKWTIHHNHHKMPSVWAPYFVSMHCMNGMNSNGNTGGKSGMKTCLLFKRERTTSLSAQTMNISVFQSKLNFAPHRAAPTHIRQTHTNTLRV